MVSELRGMNLKKNLNYLPKLYNHSKKRNQSLPMKFSISILISKLFKQIDNVNVIKMRNKNK